MAVEPPPDPVTSRLDPVAIRRGAVAYLTIAVPCAIIIATVRGHQVVTGRTTTTHEPAAWVAATVIFLLVAPFVGGLVAARASGRLRLRHATAAVAIPGVAYLLLRIAVGAARGTLAARQVVSFALYLMIFVALAALGSYVASWRSTGTV